MQKIIRIADQDRGIYQVTCSDERHYLKPVPNAITGLPEYVAVPSVTWIASYWPNKFLEEWRARQGFDEAEAIKKAAGEKGSVIHLAIEKILKGQEFRIDTKVEDKSRSSEAEAAMRELTYEELVGVYSFVEWKTEMEQDYDIETIENEITIFSEIHGYAGTVDWVVRFTPKPEGKNPLKLSGPTPFVIDFKTSQAISKAYRLQLSAYRVALENGENPINEKNPNGTETGKIVDLSGLRTAVLHVGYRHNKDGYKFTETKDEFADFKIAYAVWKSEHTSERNGEMLTPGFTKREFPIVLSPAKPAPQIEEALPITPGREKKTKSK
jgi:hypothetical protein